MSTQLSKLALFCLGILTGLSAAGNTAQATTTPANGLYLNSDGSPLLSLLASAERSIDIEIYTMGDPTVRTLLRDALSRQVLVRVVKDPNPLGETCNVFAAPGSPQTTSTTTDEAAADCDDQRQLVSDIRAAGGTYEPFNKKTLCPNGGGNGGTGCFEHGKIAIADSQVAMLSTGNFDDTNLCIAFESETECDRDYSMIDDDSAVVGTLESIFNSDLAGTAYDVQTVIPSSLTNVLTVSPFSLQPIVDFINSAQTSIDVETQYLKEPTINSALEAAATRGVTVSVTTASICAFGHPSNSDVKDTNEIYGAFDQAGISSSMFNASNLIDGKKGYLHAKVIVVDGTRAWMGSENSSTESLTENREYGIFFDTPNDVNLALNQIKADHDSSNSESWQDSLNCVKDDSLTTSQTTSHLLTPWKASKSINSLR